MRGSVSVVMATYNGDRYLRDQLASIREQDLLPAELLIGDDGSTDATHEILQQFRTTAPFPVSIEHNAERLGVGENFLQTAARATTTHLAFADQDDVWFPAKLRRCLEVLEAQDTPTLVTHSSHLVDERLRRRLRPSQITRYPRTYTMRTRRYRGFGLPMRQGFAMVFDASLLSIAQKPRPQSQFAIGPMLQDEWIQFVALGLGQMIELPEVLAWHRLHESSVTSEDPGHDVKYNVRRSLHTSNGVYAQRAALAESYAEWWRELGCREAAHAWEVIARRHQSRVAIHGAERWTKRVGAVASAAWVGSYLPKRFLGLGFKPALKDTASLIMRTSLGGSPTGLAENRHGPSAGICDLDAASNSASGATPPRSSLHGKDIGRAEREAHVALHGPGAEGESALHDPTVEG
jgi:glycosyltransferase involved in cell wall biosynthesis